MKSRRWMYALAQLLLAAPVGAVDGVVEINQARALAGGVTTGDTPGFPVTISQPGSYRLTSGLNSTNTGVPIVRIEVSGSVKLDLNGFSITGPNECSGVPLVCTGTASSWTSRTW